MRPAPATLCCPQPWPRGTRTPGVQTLSPKGAALSLMWPQSTSWEGVGGGVSKGKVSAAAEGELLILGVIKENPAQGLIFGGIWETGCDWNIIIGAS